MKKFISKAILRDDTSNNLPSSHPDYVLLDDLELDVDFACNLVIGDTIWFNNEDFTQTDYSYVLNFSSELLSKWAGGFYQVVIKRYEGNFLVIEVVEVHVEENKEMLNGYYRATQSRLL